MSPLKNVKQEFRHLVSKPIVDGLVIARGVFRHLCAVVSFIFETFKCYFCWFYAIFSLFLSQLLPPSTVYRGNGCDYDDGCWISAGYVSYDCSITITMTTDQTPYNLNYYVTLSVWVNMPVLCVGMCLSVSLSVCAGVCVCLCFCVCDCIREWLCF